jgi:hypothetical protein
MRLLVPFLVLVLIAFLMSRNLSWHEPSKMPEVAEAGDEVPANVFPGSGAADWDYIGTFTLQDGSTSYRIRLYYEDSDNVADKQMKRTGFGPGMSYPNHFALHAVYRVGSGPWQYRNVLGGGRMTFTKVVEAKRDRVHLLLQPKFMILIQSDKDWARADQMKDINKPYPWDLFIKDGVPTVECMRPPGQ